MLPAVRGNIRVNDWSRRQEIGGACFVDAGDTERRFKTTGWIQRDAVEAGKMGWPDEDGDVDRLSEQCVVRMRGNRARVHEAGMRGDEGKKGRQGRLGWRRWSGRHGAPRGREVAVHGRGEVSRLSRIPTPSDSRAANVRHDPENASICHARIF